MKIVNETILDEFRTPGRCEFCRQFCPVREPHHVLARGIGGGGRMDVPVNLLALGATRPFPACLCHGRIHNGRIDRAELLEVIAHRESLDQAEVLDILYRLRRAPKTCAVCAACQATGLNRQAPALGVLGEVVAAAKAEMDALSMPGVTVTVLSELGPCPGCDGAGILDQHGEPWRG
jgi:hypothetical protein